MAGSNLKKKILLESIVLALYAHITRYLDGVICVMG